MDIHQNWAWKQRNPSISILDELSDSEWRAVKAFPSEIHVELLHNGLIPDPYIGFNEHKVQWIGQVEWLYKTTFPYDGTATYTVLQFLGLDTVCDVYLNGERILQADNQFQTHIVPVKPQSSNVLLLHFKSAAKLAKALEEKMGKVRAGSTNLGDPSRVYVRKAQYDWRWDWGPELMTCGPYRPITLIAYNARISEIQTHALVVDDSNNALKVDVELEGTLADNLTMRVTLGSLDGTNIQSEDIPLKRDPDQLKGLVSWKFSNDKIKLWWPVGYGDQNLYKVTVSLLVDGNAIDTVAKTIGFRTVKLIQEPITEPDQYGTGTTFLFEINGVRMFMGGSNWIPADNFLTTVSPERYRAWLTLLKDGNQNMIRIWGGGIYEPDVFYDLCDELGILVWQDFQFACGVYPAHDEFLASVRKEAEDNVKRLRSHPSIALFCGNNEDYQMILQWGDVKDFPAIKIYEELLPSLVDALTSPQIPYHRGSPYGGKGWDTSDPTIGDVHQWNVWGGKERPYQEYDNLGGRFVSEFGMPSMPCMKTIDYWMQEGDPQGNQRYAQSPLMSQHCRAGMFERRFSIALNDNFKVTTDLETAMYNTQLMQSEAVGYAYRIWRRKWGGPGKQHTAGVLVWQLNDCWPVTSWAIADYFLRPKPIYYAIAHSLASIAVGIDRTVEKNRPNDRPRQFYEFGTYQTRGATIDIWGVNSHLDVKRVSLEIHAVDLNSSWTHKETHDVELLPNQSTELLSVPCPCPPKDGSVSLSGYEDWTTSHSVVIGVRLLDPQSGEVVARAVDWPQPYRYLQLPDPALKVSVDENGSSVTIEALAPAKCVVLQAKGEGPEVKWSDNGLDLMPGDKRVLQAIDLNGRGLEVSYLGKEKATSCTL